MWTFEFPTPAMAADFCAVMNRDRYATVKQSHRVVDVTLVEDLPRPAEQYGDLARAMATLHGAEPARKAERLYTLHTWDATDPRHCEVTLTTLPAFLADNPSIAAHVQARFTDPDAPSAFSGGGGAEPCWRLARTDFVGQHEPAQRGQRVFRREVGS